MKIIARNVTRYIGDKKILDNVSLELESGKIYGFVGRNGSGKTMLFRALSGLMDITEGEIMLNDKVLHKDMRVLPDMGILIENAGLYGELTGYENLKLLAKLNKKIGDKEIKDAIVRVGLDPQDKRTVKKYSLGMKQRITLAQAIMEKTSIIMLDEPTNALDEEGVMDIRKIILEEKERGAIILIASHNKDDIDMLADEVYIIKDGKVKERGAINEA